MQQDNHFAVAGLVERVFDIVVQDVNLVTPNTSVLEPVGVGLEDAAQPLLNNVGADVEILELGVALALVDDELVLLDEVGLLLLLGLARLVLFLDLLDQPEGSVQVGAGCADFARLFDVGASVSAENGMTLTRVTCEMPASF